LPGRRIDYLLSRTLASLPDEARKMEQTRSIEELTQRNVAIIAEMERQASEVSTRGEHIADWLAQLVGSWWFLLGQTVILFLWIILNLTAWFNRWDPYPFILLNLALSFQAAYTAPILMISHNRQGKVIERRNHLDLQINLLAEQETTEILRLLRLLCKHTGVRLEQEGNGQVLQEPTEPARILKQIEEEIEDRSIAHRGAQPKSQ
jgi:uncharacterized membrane protein